MVVYDINFLDVMKMVEKEVVEFIFVLYEDGKIDFFNIGEICYIIYNIYEFVFYDNKIIIFYFYGFDLFEMKELLVL